MRTLLILLVLGIIVAQGKVWHDKGGFGKLAQLNEELENQRDENRRLAERNQTLAAEVADLKEGLEAVEERARSEMGMIKDGEIFYQLIEPVEAGDAEPHDSE